MTVDRLDKETDRNRQKHVLTRPDDNGRGKKPSDALKEPLEIASTRLRKKLKVRRAIRESPAPQDGVTRKIPPS